MIVVRFAVKCIPGRATQAKESFRKVMVASRTLEGVVSFDIGQDVSDPDSFVAVEVFEDRAALDRQESLPEVQSTIKLLGEIAAAQPEETIFHVSSSEQAG